MSDTAITVKSLYVAEFVDGNLEGCLENFMEDFRDDLWSSEFQVPYTLSSAELQEFFAEKFYEGLYTLAREWLHEKNSDYLE